MTWYDDDYLENDEGEVDLKVKEDGSYNEKAGLITKLAVAVTYADLDLRISTTTLAGATLLLVVILPEMRERI